MKNQYVYNTITNIVDRLDNSGILNENEAFIYDDNYYSLQHESGAKKYKVVDNAITERIQQEIEATQEYKDWYVDTYIIPELKPKFLDAYGSYGALGSLIPDARTRFGAQARNTIVFADEMRSLDNWVWLEGCTNIEYSDKNLSENEQGFLFVKDPTQDAVIVTYSLANADESNYNPETFVICLVGVILEYGYQISDITLEYRKGNGSWNTATPIGKMPYSVFSEDTFAGTGAIQLRLTLRAGHNDTSKHAGLISFAIVGI